MCHNDGEDLPVTATEDLSAAQEEDACHDSDDHEGEDSEDMDAAAGPSGEYLFAEARSTCATQGW